MDAYWSLMTDGYVKVQQICVYVAQAKVTQRVPSWSLPDLRAIYIPHSGMGPWQHFLFEKPACWKICSEFEQKALSVWKCTPGQIPGLYGFLAWPEQREEDVNTS